MEMTIIQSGHDLTSAGLVSQETGELKDTVTFVVERGSYVVTPEQQEQRRKAQAEHERRAIERGGKRGEKFVFVDANIDFSGMRPATITKLIYLSIYAGYSEGRERKSPLTRRGGHIKKKDLADVLQISERHAASFLKEVSPTYVYADSKGYLYLDGQFFIRGGLRKKSFKQYQQIYHNGVRRLYEASKGKNHTQLGYVFMLIPFISIEHNILCWNPEEPDITKVVPMTPKEFCSRVSYNPSNISRLMKLYSSILFDVNGEKEHFCKLVCDWNGQSNARICINPAVIYAGSAYNRVEITRLYFMEKEANAGMKQ